MSSAAVLVRPVRDEELSEVAELTVSAYVVGNGMAEDSPYATQLRRAADRAAASPLLVATREDRVVGAVSLCPFGTEWCEIARPGEVELRMLVVAPEAFGTGVGDALVAKCVEHAGALGAQRIVLSVVATNEYAHALYTRHGFTPDPERDTTPVPGVALRGYERQVTGTTT